MNTHEARVKAQYNQLAQRYDRRWSRYITNTLSFLRDWAEIAPSAVVLDVACGTGELERLILENKPTQSITGMDISERMLTQARQKLSKYLNIALVSATASALPFPDQSFDVVISANSFHYFSDPELSLFEMKRVLKPDGKLVILDWCKDFLLCRICDWILKQVDPAYQQCYTEAEFYTLLQSTGFRITRTQTVRFDLIWGLMAVTAVP